jgi:hypothetical protein
VPWLKKSTPNPQPLGQDQFFSVDTVSHINSLLKNSTFTLAFFG